MKNLGEWIKSEWKTQGALAEELGIQQSRISKWLGGEPVPRAYQDKIRALKYKGPWPNEEGKGRPTETLPAVTPGFPEKEIIRATELVYQFMGAGSLTPLKMGHYIATVAELLVRGHQPEEIRDRVAPVIRDLAAALPPGAHP